MKSKSLLSIIAASTTFLLCAAFFIYITAGLPKKKSEKYDAANGSGIRFYLTTTANRSGNEQNTKISENKTPCITDTRQFASDQREYDINIKMDVLKTAVNFRKISDSVNYDTVELEYRKNLLYFFSSAVNAEEEADKWIEKIKKNKIVSESYFVSNLSHVYKNAEDYMCVRGKFYIKYSPETDEEYLKSMGLKAECWYSRDEELLFYIAVDDHKWERGEWVFYRGYVLEGYREETV